MLAALGRACYRHRRLVALLWLVAVVGGGALGTQVFARLGVDYGGSSMESLAGYDRLAESAPYGPRVTGLVDGVDAADPRVATAVTATAADLAAVPGVARVLTPYTVPPEAAAGLRSADGRAVLVVADLAEDTAADTPDAAAGADGDAAATAAVEAVEERLRALDAAVGGEVLVGSDVLLRQEYQEQSERDLRRGEIIALPLVLVVMVVVFGGIVAAGLPVLAALGAISGGLATLYGATYLLDLDPSVPSVTTVLGLGLCVDYGLLLVSRYREEAARGSAPEEAVVATMRTAGRTITFSALTVAVSLSGLFLFDITVFRGLAVAGASAVLFSLAAALTLTPALLGLARRRIRTPAVEVPDDGAFARLARATRRRPWLVALTVGGLLLAAGTPFLHANFRNGSVDLLPEGFESRQFAETLAERFPAQAAEPVVVVARDAPGGLVPYADRLRSDPALAGLAREVGTPEARDGGHAVLEVVPTGTSQGEAARDLVRALRAERPGGSSWVTGDAAVLVDFSTAILDALPWALLWLAGATFVLLFLMTGSLLVPLKALVMNTLSLGATFGALVWVFQDGNLSGLLGFTPVEGLETWVPVITFAFAFGLSMDYEVFLLARVKELYDAGLGNDRAVEVGLQRSGRIITSAALVMVIVCLGFASGELLDIKQLGTALAVAVAVDATLVRCLLVPATMTMLGDRNWWAPGPLRRLHDRFGLREHAAPPYRPKHRASSPVAG